MIVKFISINYSMGNTQHTNILTTKDYAKIAKNINKFKEEELNKLATIKAQTIFPKFAEIFRKYIKEESYYGNTSVEINGNDYDLMEKLVHGYNVDKYGVNDSTQYIKRSSTTIGTPIPHLSALIYQKLVKMFKDTKEFRSLIIYPETGYYSLYWF